MASTLTDDVLRLIKNSGDKGMTSTEISELTGENVSRITAGLFSLHAEECVRREVDTNKFGQGDRSIYRYWYVHERAPFGEGGRGRSVLASGAAGSHDAPPKRKRHRNKEPHKRDILIMIPVGDRGSLPLDFAQARTVYNVLREIFGEKA
jgi:hypothetical protein